ncbi:MAG TPA: DUF262 domain-containing protein [Thermoanaerobaculia bacterium]|nr:DUF262 domain-containing protein [Thermoanaerobaculia bacterium]
MARITLAQRPEGVRLTVQELLERVRSGRIRIPAFQRPMRWGQNDHQLLLDSVLRGFPAGVFLFWRRLAPSARVVLGPWSAEVASSPDAWWVVDGQQRITSLTGTLLHPDPLQPASPFAFYYDLACEEFVHATPVSTERPEWLPVNRLVDAADLGIWLAQSGLDLTRQRQAHEVGRRLREYEIVGYLVDSPDERALRAVFDRANTSGKRMMGKDVFQALHAGLDGERPATFATLATELHNAVRFGIVSDQWLHKAALAIRGIDATQSLKGELREPGALKDTFTELLPVLRKAIELLRGVAEIPHFEVLPYGLPLAVLARFYHLFPLPKERSELLLSRWVWRGAVSQAHRGESVPYVRKNYRALVAGDEEGSVQRLLALVPPVPPASRNDLELSLYRPATAATKIELAALAALGPQRLVRADPLEPELTVDVNELFGFVKASKLPHWAPGITGTLAARTIADRLLHPPVESDNEGWATILASASDDALDSHGFDGDARRAMRARDWKAAFEARALRVQHIVSEFVAQRARWGENDRPSLEYLAVDSTPP